MSETKKKYRLFKVAKELNTGSSTLVDHLAAKGFEIDNSPNAKLNDEMYTVLVRDFASEMLLKKQAEEIREKKQERRFKPEEATGEEEQEHISAHQLRSGYLEGSQEDPEAKTEAPVEGKEEPKAEEPKKEAPVKKEPEEVAPPKKEAPVEKVVEKVAEEPKTEEKAPALKIKGKIDLSQFDRKKGPKTSPPKAKTVEPKAKKVDPPVKKETPVAKKEEKAPVEVPKEKTPPVAEVKVEVPKEKEPEAEKVQPVAKKVKPEAKKGTPAKVEEKEKPAAETETPAKEETVVRAVDHSPKLAGLKVLGSIKLPGDRRKKKEEAGAKKGAADGDAKKKRKRRRKRKNPAPVTSKPNERKKPAGRGDRGKKEELSEKEIKDIIKSTLADLNRGAGRSRQRLRREKRAAGARRREKDFQKQVEDARVLEVTEFITANELSNLMTIPVTEIITKCMELGLFVSINQRLEGDIITLLAEEYQYEVRFIDIAEKEFEEAEEEVDDPEDLVPRAPIVTVMGHVDHGKTSLLDHIRSENVIAGEAGGITQHIGAYEVKLADGKEICFLDTPGHEAFTAMRARGAKVTDLVIIVIACDDAVMPQTKEAINHSQAAGVPMIFALNKMDKEGADPERIRTQLSEMNILLEDWGGKFQSQEISAKNGTNIDELLEKVLLEAEMLELKANPDKPATGTIIEARLDKGRGVVATVLIQEGTLRIGDSMVAGVHFGRVRAMMDERGNRIKEAGPSTPVQLLGLTGTPTAGDRFVVYEEERKAKEIAQKRNELYREQALRQQRRPTLEEVAKRGRDFQELNIIVKGDVDGSVEALSDSLLKLSFDEIQVNVIHKGVGQITEADVLLATASNAIIIGFQVRPSLGARKLAEGEGIDIRLYSIIYAAIGEVKDALEGMLSPDIKEEIVGTADVREVFKISKVGAVAGCRVLEGQIVRKERVRLIRDGIVLYEGTLASLKRFKDDARDVQKGFECGIQITGYNDIKIGDVIEQYQTTEVARKLKQ